MCIRDRALCSVQSGCWRACLQTAWPGSSRSTLSLIHILEWIKLYGILLGREEQAEQVFSAQETAVQPILSQEPTGKSCAFFSLTTNNPVSYTHLTKEIGPAKAVTQAASRLDSSTSAAEKGLTFTPTLRAYDSPIW